MQEPDIRFQLEPELLDMLREGTVQHERYDSVVIDDFKIIPGIESSNKINNLNIKNKKYQIYILKLFKFNFKYEFYFKIKKYMPNNTYKNSENNKIIIFKFLKYI